MLLALLDQQPNTGYGLGRLLQKELSHLWEARLQQIYGELAKLQHEGLVDVECIELPNRPAKKVYSLTPSGETALDEWLALRPVPAVWRDELLVRLYRLERTPTDLVIRRLEERRDDCEREVGELRRRIAQTPRTDPAHLGRLLGLDAALAHAEAHASWCARTLGLMRQGEEVASIAEERQRRAGARDAS